MRCMPKCANSPQVQGHNKKAINRVAGGKSCIRCRSDCCRLRCHGFAGRPRMECCCTRKTGRRGGAVRGQWWSTAASLVRRINADTLAALTTPDLHQRFAQYLRSEFTKWLKVVKESGVRVERDRQRGRGVRKCGFRLLGKSALREKTPEPVRQQPCLVRADPPPGSGVFQQTCAPAVS